MSFHPVISRETSSQTDDLAQRLRSTIQHAASTCECREQVDEAIARFMTLEQARRDRSALLKARGQLVRIIALTQMLAELDDISWTEVDRSAFEELAQLFDDVARAATLGSAAMQMISGEVRQ
ncbi:hypothetical protein [Devosia sp. RR2S18]|uniref:hypothetical protein n=1 Tax=Devosia rhizosphaerae TaxID=3049774 RepID=UPI0025405BC2|nr:hypothetical protein [Devosia sp. RR2S18]WIJ26885.1 hypothetical protein QOV41_09105 [Devosia sp. RR2S18]